MSAVQAGVGSCWVYRQVQAGRFSAVTAVPAGLVEVSAVQAGEGRGQVYSQV